MISKQIAVLIRPQKAMLDHVNNKVATLPGLKVQMKVTMYDHDDEINHENVKALMHPQLKIIGRRCWKLTSIPKLSSYDAFFKKGFLQLLIWLNMTTAKNNHLLQRLGTAMALEKYNCEISDDKGRFHIDPTYGWFFDKLAEQKLSKSNVTCITFLFKGMDVCKYKT
jgi:hypothetical protein